MLGTSIALRAMMPTARLAPVLIGALWLGACSPQVIKHGHQFHENDVQQIQAGMSQDQVKLTLGTPTTTSAFNGATAYYYISSTEQQTAFLTPSETDRQVLAVYFTQLGSVERVANYGIKDGKVFDFVSRTTPVKGAKDEFILKQLFRNLGKKQLFGD
jgi:outer membrane protein assembly factor BamE (lipoprotein component of BamABCDE complex)